MKSCQKSGQVAIETGYLLQLRAKAEMGSLDESIKSHGHMLQLLAHHPKYLSDSRNIDITEHDYMRVILSPLLEYFFTSSLRIKA
ncbi:hypothetical protein VTP01DRAFT_7782, partial [Rhizomucor pusillus]|uniref:uncharacterized protein n=1 Tax=Rhizomucor pusillus TaxID=4840 RepID=UPI003742BA5E